jgi:hypothetical protein
MATAAVFSGNQAEIVMFLSGCVVEGDTPFAFTVVVETKQGVMFRFDSGGKQQ